LSSYIVVLPCLHHCLHHCLHEVAQ
jgi:hypothetical protein